MDQDLSAWYEIPPALWDDGQALAYVLAHLGADVGAGQETGQPLRSAAPGTLEETSRRLIALFHERVARVARLLDAQVCALYLAEPRLVDMSAGKAGRRRWHNREERPLERVAGSRLSLRALYGVPWDEDATRRGVPVPLDGPAMQAFLDQTPLLSERTDVPVLHEWAAKRQIHRWLYVPLLGLAPPWSLRQHVGQHLFGEQGDLTSTSKVSLGVLAVGRTREAPEFSETETRLLGVLGEELVLAIEHVRLSEQAQQAYEVARRYKALARDEARWEQVFDELSEGVMVLAPSGEILRLNAAGRELLGWLEPTDSKGLGWIQEYEALHMRSALGEPLRIEEWPVFRALRGVVFRDQEVHYIGPNGVERFLAFSGRPVLDEQGRVKLALLNFHEATGEEVARAQLEQMVQLADQRAHYVGLVLEAMTDSVLVCNSAGMLLLVNTAGQRTLGIERLSARHYPLSQLVADFQVRLPNGRALPTEDFPVARALRGETVRDVEVLLRPPGADTDLQMSISAAPVRERGAHAAILGAVAVLVDVTQARELDRAKDEFLALAAHELKSPITSIRGFAQLLQRGVQRAPEGRERRGDMQWVGRILAQTERLTQLVEEMTDAARADLGRFDLRLRQVPLGALLRRVVEAQQVTTDRHQIELHLPQAVLFVRGDEMRLEQVFSNLVGNAIKYSPAGGPITITVQEPPVQPASPALVEVAIQDQGQGISSSDLERVFSRFTRAESVRQSKLQGLGLGLYIARAIIEAHGGTIEAQSEGLGKGSTFVVRLPLMTSQG